MTSNGTLWLGSQRGYLTDWITQRWVCLTGRRVAYADQPWIQGPIGDTRLIGQDYFDALAQRESLELRTNVVNSGLLTTFSLLAGPGFAADRVDPAVARFYEETSAYFFDVWSEWCGAFRPFGWLLARLFSRRLQQLNVPLSSLDTSLGITSDIVELVDRRTGERRYTGWLRRLVGSGDVLYAGCYSTCRVPGHPDPCLKVVFPLPNGNATVIMRPEVHPDGSFTATSSGRRFGDPGFYFVVQDTPEQGWVRYLRTLEESIRVFRDTEGVIRGDHLLHLWGLVFLRLHYRLNRRTAQ